MFTYVHAYCIHTEHSGGHLEIHNFAIICSPIAKTSLLYGMFPGFDHLSFWYEQHVDEEECGTLVE